MRHFSILLSFACFLALGASMQAQNPVIAKQNFDGNDLNLISENYTDASGWTGGDWFGVTNAAGANIASGLPFALADDSSDASCRGGSPFPGDTQGFITCSYANGSFLGASDIDNGANPTAMASAEWIFDVSNASNLALSVEIAAMGDFEANSDGFFFEYSIDGAPFQTLITGSVDENDTQSYTMESGTPVVLDDPMLANGVKLGSNFQTIVAAIPTSGNVVRIRLTALADGGTEAYAFDNICITGMQTCTELFISEYVEGSSNNKCIEIYNPTGNTVNLAAGAYALKFYSNGSTSASVTINLTGSVAPYDVYVVCQSSSDPLLLAQADQTNGAGWYNGDDAVELSKDGVSIDVIGQIGFDPGTEWGSGLTSTADNTIRRKASVSMGDPNGSNAFDPSVEWDGFANNTFDGIGAHTSACAPAEPICLITNIYLTDILGCNDNDSPIPEDDFFAANIVVEYQGQPAGGTLVITGDILFPYSGEVVVPVADLTGSPFVIDGTYSNYARAMATTADGLPVSLTATFSDEPSCTNTNPVAGIALQPCSLPDCTPVINEIDYDNPGTDDREFVELYNPCDAPINLGDYQLVLVNGATGAPYVTQTLPAVMLMPGDFFVICGSMATVPNCDFQISPTTNLIQNGSPDAVALLINGVVADAVSYEGSVPGYTQGSGTGLEDIGVPGLGIGRFPDGANTNQNNVDFTQQCITPGEPNSGANEFCSLPDGYSVDVIGCNGLATAEYEAQTGTFSISSTCNYFGGAPTSDYLTFVSRELCGNGEVTAHVASVLPNIGYAGIMMRESAAPGARMASFIRFADGTKRVVYRVTPGGPYGIAPLPSTQGLDYLRITRQGQYFLYYASYSGAPGTWNLVFAQYTPMSECIRAGMAVSSFTNGAITLADFDNVFIGNNVLPLTIEESNTIAGIQGKQGVVQVGSLPQLPSAQEALSFAIYPNPVVNELTVAFEQRNVQEAEITILSLEGKQLYRGIHQADGNTVRLPLDGLQMAAGMYIITVKTGDAVVTERFMKAN